MFSTNTHFRHATIDVAHFQFQDHQFQVAILQIRLSDIGGFK